MDMYILRLMIFDLIIIMLPGEQY